MKYDPVIALDADLAIPLDAKVIAAFWKGDVIAMR
jgi:hypothetical protein